MSRSRAERAEGGERRGTRGSAVSALSALGVRSTRSREQANCCCNRRSAWHRQCHAMSWKRSVRLFGSRTESFRLKAEATQRAKGGERRSNQWLRGVSCQRSRREIDTKRQASQLLLQAANGVAVGNGTQRPGRSVSGSRTDFFRPKAEATQRAEG